MMQEGAELFIPPPLGGRLGGGLVWQSQSDACPQPSPPPIGEGIAKGELSLLLHGIRQRYGYDFSHYSAASLARRLAQLCATHRITRYTELLDRVFHDAALFEQLLLHLSITVTDLFRDPPFWLALRERIVPLLKTFPFVKIWHAGCATGEEVYSMAIMLHEEGFLHRVQIYATDFNTHALDYAQKAVYPHARLAGWQENYAASGGDKLSRYYQCGYDLAKLKDYLKERITFSYHNLVTDGVFGEMNLILCRNVLIYFDRELQNRVYQLFAQSLRHGGILCLGSKEMLRFSAVEHQFDALDSKLRIYRKCEVTHA